MKFLSLQQRVDFVYEVVKMTTVDGVYHPALFDIIFRLVALKYFADTDYSELPQDEWAKTAYDDWDRLFRASGCTQVECNQIESMREACEEQIKIEHEDALVFAQLNKKDALAELLALVEQYLKKSEEQLDGVNLNDLIAAAKTLTAVDKEAVALEIATNPKTKKKVKTTIKK